MARVFSHPPEWDRLVAAANVKDAVSEHLGFLCETPECRAVLGQLTAQATVVTIGHGDGMTTPAEMPVLRIHSPYLEDGKSFAGAADPVALTAFPGFTGPRHKGTHPGFHQLAMRHNGFAVHADLPDNWNFRCVLTPLDQAGGLQDVGGFEAAEIQAESGLVAGTRAPLLWDHSDFVTVGPRAEQLEWHLVSHAACTARRITNALGPAALVLRLIAASILGHGLEHFLEIR
jgi:hypothetical protein